VNSYRGNKSNEFKHDYAWYDAIHDKIDRYPNVCGYNLTKPCDDYDKILIQKLINFKPWKSCDWNGCRRNS